MTSESIPPDCPQLLRFDGPKPGRPDHLSAFGHILPKQVSEKGIYPPSEAVSHPDNQLFEKELNLQIIKTKT
jgi:hypothetical protein